MKKYNIINNSLGWFCFLVAAVTYLLTLEPTASFWDCPEFISQGYKLEVGHPPGNPIFMLAARFFVTLFGGQGPDAALAVNSMSALLSAATIMLLFWTITHLVRRLIVKDDATEMTLTQMLVIFGSGMCGALAYTWSDTFWFSAVEGEVYAFSSFCTALVFWFILKWENRADQPHSDRYLILIAYVIGVSIAVHLLNLLCIPAVGLVIYYRKFKNTTAKGSLIALGISALLVALILYGLVPGFVEIAQDFELLTVNVLGMSYNSGVLIYAILLIASFVWCIVELWRNTHPMLVKISFILSISLSGMPFIGNSAWIPVLLIGGMCVYFIWFCPKVPRRILSIAVLSVAVMFVGYSSYALLLIRANANPPINQNSVDNVFALGSYLNREQYGERPLLYGRTFNSQVVYQDANGKTQAMKFPSDHPTYDKVVKRSADEPDRYVMRDPMESSTDYMYTPELDMLFPRMYSPRHAQDYLTWTMTDESDMDVVSGTVYVNADGNSIGTELMLKPTFVQNLRFFLGYQLSYMYWRYFMWNFAGRQNDYQGQGEPNHGNWITGIPFIDNAMYGDQSLLPDELGKGNKGHNVFYMLPLFMGIFGLLWQAFYSKRGIEQFWVVFFLFFMTGIAIVLYLNQTPAQPRERDYAFAGSFYAFAIWLGMGVAALWHAGCVAYRGADKAAADTPRKVSVAIASVAVLIGLIVPLQMVSQTWDDHDRSGRYTARDYGMNYLSSVEPNAIIFVNGDNDTFPLWYAQEVENYRTDVRVVNLSYLTTPWYAYQQMLPSYEAAPVDMQARPEQLAYDRMQQVLVYPSPELGTDSNVPMSEALAATYASQPDPQIGVHTMPYMRMYIPSNLKAAVETGTITSDEIVGPEDDTMQVDLGRMLGIGPQRSYGYLDQAQLLTLDIVNKVAANGWKRPVYFAVTVGGGDHFVALDPYMRRTGLAYQVTPIARATNFNGETQSDTEKMYANVVEKFRWGGLDQGKDVYLDETVRHMVTHHRDGMANLATDLITEGAMLLDEGKTAEANAKFVKGKTVMNMIEDKLPARLAPYQGLTTFYMVGNYLALANHLNDSAMTEKGKQLYAAETIRLAQYMAYYQSMIQSGHYYNLQKREINANQWVLYMMLASYYLNVEQNLDYLQQAVDKAGVNFDLTNFLDRQLQVFKDDDSTAMMLQTQRALINFAPNTLEDAD